MDRFDSAYSYMLIYVFAIYDDKHRGCLKVGKATIKLDDDSKYASLLQPNSTLLNKAAKERIDSYTKTAGITYTLLHTELAERKVFRKGSVTLEYFEDHKVHEVLKKSGVECVPFEGSKEWFRTDLNTVKNAIKAVKEGKTVLTVGEVTHEYIPIDFRPEQKEAIEMTCERFKKHNKMLWNAKMRFGKTLSALEVIKRMKYQKTIILTHRPVVDDGWHDDFNKIFWGTDYIYLEKGTDETEVAKHIKSNNFFIYFASIQDLRGSDKVGGKFVKNKLIYSTEWDLVIVDEAHEGTRTSLGDDVLKEIIKEQSYGKTKQIYLSGTPFNLVNDFDDDEVYTWDYVMEQKAKAEWDILHGLDSNPYEGLPKLSIFTYDIADAIPGYEDLEDKAFNFREFFRVWTGVVQNDGAKIPDNSAKGKFVHENDVKSFLNLLCRCDDNSNYPFSKEEYQNYFNHTLWMLPGVKEAAALESLLKQHKVFGLFNVVNVAGEVPDETKDPLERVNKAISDHPEDTHTITLSCGRLTTGVSVKPWTAVLMLSGSQNTSASQYLQTIFRVQTPANINGKIKDRCFVFDFAPDRTLQMVAEAGKLGTRPGHHDSESEEKMREFLNFCPVIAIQGSEMRSYDVDSMLRQLKRYYAARVAQNGFDDVKLYNDKLLKLTDLDKKKFEDLKAIVGESKAADISNKIVISESGLGPEEQEAAEEAQKKKRQKKELTEEEKEALRKLKEAREAKGKAISILRAISIRIPLLVYGAEKDIDEDITIDHFAELIDDESWKEFMPAKITKEKFNEFTEYYDKDIFIEAGNQIRHKAKAADELPPFERVKRIAEIFATFKNPDKETVLTPWRVVNLHMSSTLGGWDFFDAQHSELMEEYPRFVDQGDVTKKTLANTDAKILEINSKSGLYPLYVAFSIYQTRLNAIAEDERTPEMQDKLWRQTLKENIYVVCKTEMAKYITKRTLLGYKKGKINAHYFEDLVNQFKNKSDQVVKKIISKNYWNVEGSGNMKFDAVVGNPPYQEETITQNSETNGQAPRKNIFHFFQMTADTLTNRYTSMVYPGSRWIHRSGKGLENFGITQINDAHLRRIDFFPNAQDIFKDVAIADGITFVLKDKSKISKGFDYVYHSTDGEIREILENPGEELITLNPKDRAIVDKVLRFVYENRITFMFERVLSRSLFGIESDFVEKNPSKVRQYSKGDVVNYPREIKLYANDKAGKAGRSCWFVTDRDNIPTAKELIDEWQVVVSSANAGGQKRDNQIEIIDNHSAFGRSRVALGSFRTEQEAENFFKYAQTDLIKFMFLMTDENLTSLGKKVPDVGDYSNNCKYLDFTKDLNSQLATLFNLTSDDSEYIKSRLSR